MTGISRFSSRQDRLSHVFLKDRLAGATSYDRIAGYFRSSIFDLVHEEIESIGKVRIVCNADLDARDIAVAALSQRAIDRAMISKWHQGAKLLDPLLEQSRFKKLYDILTSGNVEIRVVARSDAPFLHGKAGLITSPDGTTSSFVGSINETIQGWDNSYEIVWEDRSEDAAAWVRDEFDWLWSKAIPLPEAIIEEIGREANRIEVRVDDLEDDPRTLAKAAFVESPLVRAGETLAPWQKSFAGIFVEHIEKYGSARIVLADEVGVGKTLSMAITGALSVLQGNGPFLILCPATLTLQWQTELWDKLGLASYVWARTPQKGWQDVHGNITRSSGPKDILRCPGQIGIVSTGLLVHGGPEALELQKGSFGTIALDEGHKARVRRGIGSRKAEPGHLYRAMEGLAKKTQNLIIGTATPIQTDRREIWDLMKLLAADGKFEHVLGRRTSQWWDDDRALQLLSGNISVEGGTEAWDWLRSPLPNSDEHWLFDQIHQTLQTVRSAQSGYSASESQHFSSTHISTLGQSADDLRELVINGEIGSKVDFLKYHSPLARHVVLRRRKTLEDAGLMEKVDVVIHPQEHAQHPDMVGLSIRTPNYYDQAYALVREFTQALSQKTGSRGFLVTLMEQRICSSIAAGLKTAERMFKSHGHQIPIDIDEPEIDDDDDATEEQRKTILVAISEEAHRLQGVIECLKKVEGQDPKARLVDHYLDQQGWLELGCIIFSQYFDTVRWIAGEISRSHPKEIVAVYAGSSKSGFLINGKWSSCDRDVIKEAVKERKVRLVCATDAACEGLNLQTLGSLINIDLPWNPSRLEQRIGRIKRFGQKRREVDMMNLTYQDTIDERIHDRLSQRMKDKHGILGTIPDTIKADWIDDLQNMKIEFEDGAAEQPDDIFELRYGDFLTSDDDWETCQQVIHQSEIFKRMTTPW